MTEQFRSPSVHVPHVEFHKPGESAVGIWPSPSRDLETRTWVLLVAASHACLLQETPGKQPLQQLSSLLCVSKAGSAWWGSGGFKVPGNWGLKLDAGLSNGTFSGGHGSLLGAGFC